MRNYVTCLHNIDSDEIQRVNELLTEHILISDSQGCKVVPKLSSLKDCIYFWSNNKIGDDSEVVDAILNDGANYWEKGVIDDTGVMRIKIIKNPVTVVSGRMYIINPIHGKICDKFEIRADVISPIFIEMGDPIPDGLKEEVIETMKGILTLSCDRVNKLIKT